MIKLDEVNKKNRYVGCRGRTLGDPKAITLIALVITIVVLIILAGVAINLTLGENGILNRAKDAKLKYQIAQAKEELDLKIAELQTEKQGTATLNDLVDILKNETDMDYIVSLTEIASITGVDTIGDAKEIYVVYKIYQFKVDDKLKTEFISIVENYAPDVTITSNIKGYEGKNADGKYIAKVEVKVESKELVQSIELETVNGTITEVPTKLPYTKEIEVEIGNKYITKVTAKDGKVKKYVVEEKKEETIGSVSEFVAFRDAVNSGLTYEGKTISLTQDIDLSSICGENVNGEQISWEPIGTRSNPFKGTFDGNKNIINNLYINSTQGGQGLFGCSNGTITNVVIEKNGNVLAQSYSAAIVGSNNGTIKRCINNATIKVTGNGSGGIAGDNYGMIEECVNNGHIINNQYNCAGICSYNQNGTIQNCYNTGKIEGNINVGGITGNIGNSAGTILVGKVYNCYSTGTISGNTTSKGGIIGSAVSGLYDVKNTYWLLGTGATYGMGYANSNSNATGVNQNTLKSYATTLGETYVADGKIKNSKGEWVDNVDESGNIIYINAGYPILKWQVEE